MTDEDWILTTVRRYQGPLLTYTARMLCDSEAARDVVQETFLKLCRQSRRKGGGLHLWLGFRLPSRSAGIAGTSAICRPK